MYMKLSFWTSFSVSCCAVDLPAIIAWMESGSEDMTKSSNKTGFGPNRLYRKGVHFVGTAPNALKYHMLQDKKPGEPYGLQGTNHNLPGTGKLYAHLPTRVLMKKDKVYAWCSCGYSKTQPLCDGHHNSLRVPNLNLKPVRFIPSEDMEVWLCNCKQTKNRPFCDGSHKQVKLQEEKITLFD